MHPSVDLVLVFKGISSLTKSQAVEDVQNAEAEYTRLIYTLTDGGLKATGREGQEKGQLLVFVSATQRKVAQLVQKERNSDFLHGLSSASLPGHLAELPPAPADRLRLVHDYVTSSKTEGGLGVGPGFPHWRRIESVMILHDKSFNENWIRQWLRHRAGFNIGFEELTKIRDQFGESIALYFAFLSSYNLALFFPSVVGIIFWAFSSPYSPWYSLIITIWSVCWTEWWRARERILSARWGTTGSYRVEKRRPEFRGEHGQSGEEDEDLAFPWWKRDLRILTALPVIIIFAGILAAILTAIFLFEAFVTQLYQGPLRDYISLAPTVLFVALVPRVLALYQSFASKLTIWENHAHRSAHDYSLTIKTFALSAIVAYLGLALSAFVYVPFEQFIMGSVHKYFMSRNTNGSTNGFFESSANSAQNKIDPVQRLSNEMFAYTVTNQVTDTLSEVVLPYITRSVDNVRHGKGFNGKRATLDGKNASEKEERLFLDRVSHQVSLPDYSLFVEYAEMVTQFGYIALWSTIWPLAPVMALLNNWLELRSDAFKMIAHTRRPLPLRADSIGPWLDSLVTISWLGALTNTALVYIIPRRHNWNVSVDQASEVPWGAILVPTFLLALSSSHGYFLVQLLVKHLIYRAVWHGSEEKRALERTQDRIKNIFLESVQAEEIADLDAAQASEVDPEDEFWSKDKGIEELHRAVKLV